MQELSLHILDLVRNSIAAQATNIVITICQKESFLTISIADNGTGMDEDTVKRVESPFATSRKTRRVGLGIPLFKAAAEQCEGAFEIHSVINVGTTVTGRFRTDSIDRQPLGNLTDTMTSLIISDPDVDYVLKLESDRGTYQLDTKEIKNILDGVSITEMQVIDWIMENVNEGIQTVFGGILDEVNTRIGTD